MKLFKMTMPAFFASLALLLGPAAMAGTATANLNVSASVTNSCSITAGSLAFGAYDPTSASPADGSGSFSVTCTLGAPLSLMLGQGANADAGSTDDSPLRRMNDGANFLSYSLFQDAGMSTEWGNSAASDKTSTGTGASENHTFYGRIAAGQNTPAGSYTDTVLATVSF